MKTPVTVTTSVLDEIIKRVVAKIDQPAKKTKRPTTRK